MKMVTRYRGYKIEVTIDAYTPRHGPSRITVLIPEAPYLSNAQDVRSAFAYAYNAIGYLLDGYVSWPLGLPTPPRMSPHRNTLDPRITDYKGGLHS